MPQAFIVDLSESSLLFFFNYESRYLLRSFSSELMQELTLVYLGHDFFPIQQWAKAENLSKVIQWSGPDGLNSSLCQSLDIKELPVFLAFKNSNVVYFSKDWPNARFLQDFKTGEVKTIIQEFISSIVLDVIENVGIICESEQDIQKLDQKSYTDTIMLLQNEILNYQGLCKQQQLVIEALREELTEKSKQVMTLNEIVNSQTIMNEKLNRVQNSQIFEKKLNINTSIALNSVKPNIVDDEFWKVNDDEANEEMLDKGLWIMGLEQPVIHTSSSVKSLSVTKPPPPPLMPIDKKTLGKSKLEIQQERQMKILLEKQPIGRDGKRIPLPVIKKKTQLTSTSSFVKPR